MSDQKEEALRGIGKMISECIPDGMHFALLVFQDSGDGSHVDYSSNASRETMAAALRSCAANLERGLRPGGN